jgi:3-hydroxyacyl-[acyl-carrier-protein] dehydratase
MITMPINAADIFALLPHRYPFLLVDRVVAFEPMKSLAAIKNVTVNEPFFTGHFPGNPIMPGVLIVEAMAQVCGLLSHLSLPPAEGNKRAYLFAGIDNVRFKHVVIPGDQLHFTVEMVAKKREIWKMHATAMVDGKLACSGDLMSAVREVPND